jgi:hypothetical protein
MNTIQKTLTAALLMASGAALATGNGGYGNDHGHGGGENEYNNTNNNYNHNEVNKYDNSTHNKYETNKYDNRKTYNHDNRSYDNSIKNTANGGKGVGYGGAGGKGGSVGDTTATGGKAQQDQNQTQQQQANASANNGGVHNNVGGNNSSYNSVYREAANAVPIYNTVIGKCKMGINIGGSTVGGTGGIGAAWDSNTCHEGREKAELEQARMANARAMLDSTDVGVVGAGLALTAKGDKESKTELSTVARNFAKCGAPQSAILLVDEQAANTECGNANDKVKMQEQFDRTHKNLMMKGYNIN